MEQGSIISDFTVKSAKKDNTVISGYASVFGVIDNHNDVIEKGAFKTVCAHKVKLLWQHDTTRVMHPKNRTSCWRTFLVI